MAGPLTTLGGLVPSLRARLLVAFLAVALPPLLVLGYALQRQIARTLDEAADRRLTEDASDMHDRLRRLTREASLEVTAFGRDFVKPRGLPDEVTPASELADLPMLEILSRRGQVLYSRHWPASVGLPISSPALDDEGTLRLVPVAEGYGYRTRLSVCAEREVTSGGRRLLVRGGYFLDDAGPFASGGPFGMAVGLFDVQGQVWLAASDARLPRWTQPPLESGVSEASIGGVRQRYSALPLSKRVWLFVAQSRDEARTLTRALARFTLGLASAAILFAILFAIVLSGRVTGPLSRLGEAARRLAAGERVQPARHSGPREVRQLAAAFDSLADELAVSRPRVLQAERVAAWREMARRLAHELKNPLFPIQVSIETLRRALDAAEERGTAAVDFPRLFRESSATILEELRILRGIIDEFSRFTRLPRPELRPTDVGVVLAHVAGLHSGGPANGVKLETEVASPIPDIQGDPDLLSRALANLVANAIEASPSGATVQVRARATADKVVIEVVDHGVGLSEEDRARLFTPYFTSKPGGTGLGLAIAQSIVADHRGHIDVESEVGRGTTFRIVLPASKVADKGATP